MPTPVYPGALNTFIPNHAASGKLTVNFSRNNSEFVCNSYVQIIPTEKPLGPYRRVTIEEAGRLINTNLDNFAWPDGNEAPSGEDGLESSSWLHFECFRRAFAWRLGDLTAKFADYDVLAEHAAIHAQQAMTARSQMIANAATNPNNYDASHVLDVTTISSNGVANQGTWSQSTTARMDIKRSLNIGQNIIKLQTLSKVKAKDLRLIISPNAAALLAETQEIIDMIKGSPAAMAQVKGSDEFGPSRNNEYGLPNAINGIELFIEDAAKVTTRKLAASTTYSYVWPDTYALLCARPGALEGVFGSPSFSTLALFIVKGYDMAVYTKRDTDNERTLGRVVDFIDCQVVAPVSGVLFENIL